MLLAYYIGAVHIEEAYRGRNDGKHEPFSGIVLTDTFNLLTGRELPRMWLPYNTARVERQQKAPIQVIVGKPPWSSGNENVDYPELEARVGATYAARSAATLKNSLYDSYKLAIRWASDRIGEQGVVAFVTNGSWIDGNVDSGVRACLAEEFSTIYVMNLRGNQRTQGERSRREGGKVLGQGSRAPVAVTVLIRNPDAAHDGCRILYRDIGDYLTRDDKLACLRKWSSVAGVSDWQKITPDRHNDWIGQRNEAFQGFYPVGSKEAKAGKPDDVVFRLFSNGYKTSRDAYLYNFSREACAANARAAIDDYMGAMEVREDRPEYSVDEIAKRYSSNVHWDQALLDNLNRNKRVEFSPDRVAVTQYRPFVKQHCYIDYTLVNRKYQQDSIFPPPGTKFGTSVAHNDLFDELRDLRTGRGLGQAVLRAHGGHDAGSGNGIEGAVLPPMGLPRVPMAPEFPAFVDAGRRLSELHLSYETCEEYPLRLEFPLGAEATPEQYSLGTRKMRLIDDGETLVVNEHIRLASIPPEAHEYEVNGRTPLGWFIDRYHVKTDSKSGIVNDANAWFDDPRDLVAAVRRIVHVSVRTVAIIEALSDPLPEPG